MSAHDMHHQDIVASLRKRGITMAGLARENGYKNYHTVYKVFSTPYPKVERIVAAALGMQPEEIWPSRYNRPRIRPRSTPSADSV